MHDAGRHVQGLRLSLAQDKAPLALMLSGGCPAGVEVGGVPLVPAIGGMTDALRATLETSKDKDAFALLLACLDEDKVDKPNLEHWLSMVRALQAVAAGAPVRGLSKTQLDDLEKAITGAIVELVECELPATGTPFHAVAAWADAMERDLPVEVFTTNYDLLLEQAFESMRSPFFDGFVGVRQPFFDNASILAGTVPALPPRFTRLWKLHGSVNWYLNDDDVVIRASTEAGDRRLIHPSHLKYDESRQMPYLALLDRLRAYLSQRGALLVTCGYSFRDRHINVVLGEGLKGNATASLIALMRSPLASYPEAKLVAGQHPNFALFCRDGAVIGTREGPWSCESEQLAKLDGVQQADPAAPVEVTLGEFEQFGKLLTSLLGVPLPEVA